MTFDRLRPTRNAAFYFSATKRNGPYRALAVPPTMKLGPNHSEALTGIVGLPEAIKGNDWISEERRQFLVERLPYWTAWLNFPIRASSNQEAPRITENIVMRGCFASEFYLI
jgi:hypothetical protein